MLVTSRLFGLTNGKSYLTNMGVKQQYRNDSILTLINTPPPLEIVNKRPYFTKRPILIALLGYMYMYIEINRGLPSFNSSFIASTETCALTIHMSAQFFQTNDFVGFSLSPGKIERQQARFPIFLIVFKYTTSSVSHILLFLEEEISTLSLITALPLRTKSK